MEPGRVVLCGGCARRTLNSITTGVDFAVLLHHTVDEVDSGACVDAAMTGRAGNGGCALGSGGASSLGLGAGRRRGVGSRGGVGGAGSRGGVGSACAAWERGGVDKNRKGRWRPRTGDFGSLRVKGSLPGVGAGRRRCGSSWAGVAGAGVGGGGACIIGSGRTRAGIGAGRCSSVCRRDGVPGLGGVRGERRRWCTGMGDFDDGLGRGRGGVSNCALSSGGRSSGLGLGTGRCCRVGSRGGVRFACAAGESGVVDMRRSLRAKGSPLGIGAGRCRGVGGGVGDI